MKKYLLLVLLVASLSSANAVDPKPKRVFIKADCSETLGSEVATSLRDAIRASAGYQLAESLEDDGGYGLVVTIHLECTEAKMSTGEAVVAIASVVGHGSCSGGSCGITPDVTSLEASLCSGSRGGKCGRDLYNSMDQYMSKSGNYIFHVMSERSQKSASKQ